MTKIFDIIHLPDNTLVVDKEAEPNDRTVCVGYDKNTQTPMLDYYYQGDSSYYVFKPSRIIASTKKIEGVPLLRIPEDNIKQLQSDYYNRITDGWYPEYCPEVTTIYKAFKAGYKAASKQYTEEDIINAIREGWKQCIQASQLRPESEIKWRKEKEHDYLQSLKPVAKQIELEMDGIAPVFGKGINFRPKVVDEKVKIVRVIYE